MQEYSISPGILSFFQSKTLRQGAAELEGLQDSNQKVSVTPNDRFSMAMSAKHQDGAVRVTLVGQEGVLLDTMCANVSQQKFDQSIDEFELREKLTTKSASWRDGSRARRVATRARPRPERHSPLRLRLRVGCLAVSGSKGCFERVCPRNQLRSRSPTPLALRA